MYPTETDGEEDEHEGGKEDNREYPARAEEQDVDTATTEFSEDQFQKQLLDYKETVGCRGELVLAVEDEGIYRAYKDNKEVIYWKQSEVLVEMIDLTEEAPTLGGSMCHRQVEAAHPHTRFEMVCGDDHAALFTASREQLSQRSHWLPHTVELSQIHRSLLNETLDSARFLRACSKAFDSLEFRYAHSLQCFATVVQMYKLMPDASIDVSKPLRLFLVQPLTLYQTRVLDKPLSAAPWVKSASISKYNESSSLLQNFSLDRAEAFSCIVMFESGQYEINPDSLSNVMAVSSGDSIFVAAPLLCDPSEKPLEQEIRRVLGNVGRPGIVLLVPPEAPRIRSPDTRDWNLINLDDYDGGEQDCFSNTSLHLSFTGASFPIDVGYFGGQDTEVYMLETLVSVHDKGHWVADLDVLKGMEDKSLHRYTGCVNGKHVKQAKGEKVVTPLGFTSIQSWEDFLERPRERGIVQAYQNWQARLAVTSVSLAQKHNTLVLPDDFCWLCDYQDLLKATSGKYGSTIIH